MQCKAIIEVIWKVFRMKCSKCPPAMDACESAEQVS